MKDKIFNMLIIIITIFVLLELLINKTIVYDSIMNALNIWVHSLIPALFPFFIISDILINYNITDYIPKLVKNFFKNLFNISDNMLMIFLLSMVSGFPSNARNTRTLYDKGLINIDEAKKLNPYCIDVSSSVETNGNKDYMKMKEFIRRCRDE